MRRPLLFQRARILRSRARHSFPDGFQLRLERLNVLVLPEHCIAEFHDGALEIGDLRLDPLQRVILGRGQCLAP